MPDFNPDKERWRGKRKWIVHNATRNREFTDVVAADKVMKFDREGRFSVSDEKVANEIREEYPRDVTVTRVHASHPSDRGHHYMFTVPELPWKVKDEKKASGL